MSDRDISPILVHYGLDVQLYSGWRTVRCPFTAGHAAGDQHKSARACVTGFACMACGVKGDAVSLIMEVENIDFRSALDRYEEWSGDRSSRVPRAAERKSWGRRPFAARDYEGDSGSFSTGVRRKPFAGR